VGDVADSPDILDARARIVVDDYFASAAQFDPGLLQTQSPGVGEAAQCQHDLVGDENFATAQRRVQTVVAPVDLLEDRLAENADALGPHGFMQHTPQIHVEATQYLLAAIDQRSLDTESVKDVSE